MKRVVVLKRETNGRGGGRLARSCWGVWGRMFGESGWLRRVRDSGTVGVVVEWWW